MIGRTVDHTPPCPPLFCDAFFFNPPPGFFTTSGPHVFLPAKHHMPL